MCPQQSSTDQDKTPNDPKTDLSEINLSEFLQEAQEDDFPEEEQEFATDADSSYAHYKGLNLAFPQFEEHVMGFEEVKVLFNDEAKYHARFAYPYLPVDGFGKAPVFFQAKSEKKKSKKKVEDKLKLVSEITVNQTPSSEEAKYAKTFLPASFWMRDQLTFFKEEKKGRFNISTVKSSHTSTRLFLSANKRPGLFLKVKYQEKAAFYKDIAIYFPAQPKSRIHAKVVHSGQAYVLVKEEMVLNTQMTDDIINTFKQLIIDSYDKLGGLYHVDSHQPIDAYIQALSTTESDVLVEEVAISTQVK